MAERVYLIAEPEQRQRIADAQRHLHQAVAYLHPALLYVEHEHEEVILTRIYRTLNQLEEDLGDLIMMDPGEAHALESKGE